MARRAITIIISIVLIVSIFTGCAMTGNGNEQTTTTKATQGATESEKTNAEPVKISIFMQGISDMEPDGDRMKALEALTNVEVEWIIPPRESFGEQLSLTLASKELPDIIESISVDKWTEGANKGAFLNLNPYKEYMKNILEWSYEEGLTQAHIDGQMFAIPRGTLVRGDPYIVRKDWVEKLNLTIPETLDEYYEFMKALAHNDPDGNNKADTYALSDITSEGGLFLSQYSQFIGIFNAFGVGLGWIEDEDGKLYNSFYVPEFKDALAYVKRLMDEKIIDPNIIVNQQYAENFYNGVSGMMRAYAGSYGSARDLVKQKDPDGEVMFIQNPAGADGIVRRTAGSKGSNGWTVISSTTKHPEAAISFVDSFLSDEGWDIICYGLEGKDYTVNDKGEKEFTEAFGQYCLWRKWLGIIRRPQSIPYYLDANMNKQDYEYSVEWLEKSQAVAVPDASLGTQTPTMLEMTADDWPARWEELCMKIIYGEKPIDAWDDMLAEYKAAGLDKVTEEMNEWYAEFKN